MNLKKMLSQLFVVGVLIAGLLSWMRVGIAIAYYADPSLDVGMLHVFNQGALSWLVGNVGGNTNFIVTAPGSAQNDLTIRPAQGTQIMVQTSAQLKVLAPGASDYLVMNTSLATLCKSTGTGAGAWVFLSTPTSLAATPGLAANVFQPCF